MRVLHVLPHAGAGAQTYIDVLSELEGYEFDVFELSSSRSPVAAAASIAGSQVRLQRLAHRADLVHLHGEVASLLSLPVLVRRPSVVTLHGLHLLRRLAPGMPRMLGRAGLRTIVTAADQVICVSQAEFDDLAWLPRRLRAKLVVVRNGLGPLDEPAEGTRERIRATLGLDEQAIAVLYLGQLEARKDPLTAARAARLAHELDRRIILLIAGAGPSAAELASFSDASIRLLGQRSDVGELLAAADLFVMPSLREGLSYAVLEALAHGVPALVSDGAGNPEAVGDAGVVFGAGDDRRLSVLMVELAADPARRSELSTRGRERIATVLSAQRMRDQTRAVYEVVLRAPGRAAGGAPA